MFLSEWREFPSAPCMCWVYYRGAGKSLAWPGRKQVTVSVRMARISFGALPCRRKKQLASRCCWNRSRPWHASELVSFLVGLKDLSALRCNPSAWGNTEADFAIGRRTETFLRVIHGNNTIVCASLLANHVVLSRFIETNHESPKQILSKGGLSRKVVIRERQVSLLS